MLQRRLRLVVLLLHGELELDLLVGALDSGRFSAQKRLVLLVFVLQEWHLGGVGSIMCPVKFFHLGFSVILLLLKLSFMSLVHLIAVINLLLELSSVRTFWLMLMSSFQSTELVPTVVFAEGHARLAVHFHFLTVLCLGRAMRAFLFVLSKCLRRRKTVGEVELAVIDGLASAILAPGHVELVLAQVPHLVVSVEWAQKVRDFSLLLLHSFVYKVYCYAYIINHS